MADVTYIYENLLPEKTPVAVNDFIRVIGSDNASYKALVSNLAKCIVETYAGSSLAGDDKTIQNAISEINAKVDLAGGGLAIAASASAMTDHDLIYVYTGNETGYTYGDWYFWNGSAFTSGGEVGSITPDASLSQEGRAADAKAVGDAFESLGERIGNTVVDTAKGLIGGDYISEVEPYHFRKTVVDLAGRLDETIVGGSLGWNQLMQNGNFADSTGWSKGGGVTSFSVANNTATLNIASGATYNKHIGRSNIPIISGHKYLVYALMASPAITQAFIQRSSDGLINASGNKTISATDTIVAGVYAETITGTANFYFRFSDTATSADTTATIKKAQIIDLTQMFGTTIADYIYSLETANAGAGVAWVKRYIDLDTYHEYDAGSIQSVEGLASHDVVGFNQWDEELELGNYNTTTGAKANSSTQIRCKNKIHVLPNTTYYANTSSVAAAYIKVLYYDADENYISSPSSFHNNTFTTPENCHYITFYMNGAYGTTYNHDICINISDPSKNGTYEPYEKHSYPLDSDVVLRGVPKLVTDHIEFDGDKYSSDGQVERRYGIVDLGTLTWSKATGATSNTRYFSNSINTVVKKVASNSVVGNILCVIFPTAAANNGHLGSAGACITLDTNGVISVYSENYSDAASFKTAMSGVYLVYELATPTTETAQPFQSPMIVGATEEYVSDSVVPVGHESKYYEDVAKKVSGLPKDFSTLIAPVEATYTATRNYSAGSYLIVKNQLYKVTSAISSGGTITPNSNVTATTIMAEILALA